MPNPNQNDEFPIEHNPIPVSQEKSITKFEAYFQGRGRKNLLTGKTTIKEGFCSGLALKLLKELYIEIDRFYKEHPTNRNDDYLSSPDKSVKLAIDNFYKEIETIITTDRTLLDSPTYQQKLKNRKIPDYVNADKKLNAAIESHQFQIPTMSSIKNSYDKMKETLAKQNLDFAIVEENSWKTPSLDYHLELIHSAEQQSVLTINEANILKAEHIPDIPYFEDFINEVFSFQATERILGVEQSDVMGKFAQIVAEETKDSNHAEKTLPLPILEFQEIFLITPEELMNGLTEIMPNQRLIYISSLQHAVAAFRLNGQYYYYDSNNPDKNAVFCKNKLVFVLKLALTLLGLSSLKQSKISNDEELLKEYLEYISHFDNLDERIDKSREWLANKPARKIQIDLLQNSITILEQYASLNDNYDEETENNIYNALRMAYEVLPPILGFEWKAYRHPKSESHLYPDLAEIISGKDFKEMLTRQDLANETLLLKLAKNNQFKTIKKILQKMKDPFNHLNNLDRVQILNLATEKENLLSFCIDYASDDRYEVIELLLELGADPNSVTDFLPLITAVACDDINLVKLLLKYGADVNAKQDDISAFTLSCTNSNSSDEIFDLLLQTANLTQLRDGLPPIFFCVHLGKYRCVEQLVKHGVDPNSCIETDSLSMPKGTSILEFVLLGGWLNMAELLLQKGANPNSKNNKGESCLVFFAKMGNLAAVQLLLNHGAKLTKQEFNEVMTSLPNPMIHLLLLCPSMAKGKTKAEQLSLLFQDYVNPPLKAGMFPTTWRHHQTLADKINTELSKNINFDDDGIKQVLDQCLQMPGGYDQLKDGEFKRRMDLVLKHFGHKPLSSKNNVIQNIQLAP